MTRNTALLPDHTIVQLTTLSFLKLPRGYLAIIRGPADTCHDAIFKVRLSAGLSAEKIARQALFFKKTARKRHDFPSCRFRAFFKK